MKSSGYSSEHAVNGDCSVGTYSRRELLRAAGLGIAGLSFGCNRGQRAGSNHVKKLNVLFISIDDLNDWIEPLGGHGQYTQLKTIWMQLD